MLSFLMVPTREHVWQMLQAGIVQGSKYLISLRGGMCEHLLLWSLHPLTQHAVCWQSWYEGNTSSVLMGLPGLEGKGDHIYARTQGFSDSSHLLDQDLQTHLLSLPQEFVDTGQPAQDPFCVFQTEAFFQ